MTMAMRAAGVAAGRALLEGCSFPFGPRPSTKRMISTPARSDELQRIRATLLAVENIERLERAKCEKAYAEMKELMAKSKRRQVEEIGDKIINQIEQPTEPLLRLTATCASLRGDVAKVEALAARSRSLGYPNSSIWVSIFMTAFCASNPPHIDEALEYVEDVLQSEPSLISSDLFSPLLAYYTRKAMVDDAMRLLRKMISVKVLPTSVMLTQFLNMYKSIGGAVRIYATLVSSLPVSLLLTRFAQFESYEQCKEILKLGKKLRIMDVIFYTSIIDATFIYYSQLPTESWKEDPIEEIWKIYTEMKAVQKKPTDITCGIVVRALLTLPSKEIPIEKLLQVLNDIPERLLPTMKWAAPLALLALFRRRQFDDIQPLILRLSSLDPSLRPLLDEFTARSGDIANDPQLEEKFYNRALMHFAVKGDSSAVLSLLRNPPSTDEPWSDGELAALLTLRCGSNQSGVVAAATLIEVEVKKPNHHVTMDHVVYLLEEILKVRSVSAWMKVRKALLTSKIAMNGRAVALSFLITSSSTEVKHHEWAREYFEMLIKTHPDVIERSHFVALFESYLKLVTNGDASFYVHQKSSKLQQDLEAALRAMNRLKIEMQVSDFNTVLKCYTKISFTSQKAKVIKVKAIVDLMRSAKVLPDEETYETVKSLAENIILGVAEMSS